MSIFRWFSIWLFVENLQWCNLLDLQGLGNAEENSWWLYGGAVVHSWCWDGGNVDGCKRGCAHERGWWRLCWCFVEETSWFWKGIDYSGITALWISCLILLWLTFWELDAWELKVPTAQEQLYFRLENLYDIFRSFCSHNFHCFLYEFFATFPVSSVNFSFIWNLKPLCWVFDQSNN